MYVPILKGRAGEFDAWAHVSTTARAVITPLFEVAPTSEGAFNTQSFCANVISSCMAGDQVIIDAAQYLPASHWKRNQPGFYTELGKDFAIQGVTFSPVVATDSPMKVVQDALAAPSSNGVTLRVTPDDVAISPGGTGGSAALVDWLLETQIPTNQLHLLIDLGGVFGRSPASVQQQAQGCITWATSSGSWASITLAMGGFPRQISDVPLKTPHRIPRVDATVWNQIRMANANVPLRYGDYAIKDGYPPSKGGGFPYPNIRYSADTEWIVWREKKLTQFPNSSIYAAYAGIVALPDFKGPKFSWGDQEIFSKSTHAPAPKGAGGGKDWLSIGFNHHLELIADRLSRLGVA